MMKSRFNHFFSIQYHTANLLLAFLVSTSVYAKSVNVDVHVNTLIGKQNPLYYGGNNIYPDFGQGIMNPDGEFDPVEINASAQLGLHTYRFPGGSEANLYKWKRAIGPIEKRIDNVSGNNRGNQSNEFGSDEFGRLLETTTFDQGVIMVSWGYETPEDAADWVEYMNAKVGANPNGGIDWAAVRAKNGHPEPYGIKYWEIGNEVYGNWELNWGSYPYELDAKRGAANVERDDKAGVNGILPFGNADRYIWGGSKYFKKQKAAGISSWVGNSIKTTGQASQKFFVKFSPVNIDDPKQPFELSIDGQKWELVTDFSQSSSNDKHFTLDTKTGEIIFGDGAQGAIPDSGKHVLLSYLSGKHPGFVDYYKKMKEVDPTIKVISTFEKESFFKHMAENNLPFDGISYHYYPPHLQDKILRKWENRHAYFSASIRYGIFIESRIKKLKKWFNQYENESLTGEEKIWFSEYDIKNHAKQFAIFHTVINKYADDVAALLGHSLFLNNNTPMINDEGIISDKALPIQVFSKHLLENFVKLDISGDQNIYLENQGKAEKNEIITTIFPAILGTASINKEQTRINVALTNTSPNERVTVQLNLKDYPINSAAVVEILALIPPKDNPLAKNSVKNPNNMRIVPIRKLSNVGKTLDVALEPASTFIVKWSDIQ